MSKIRFIGCDMGGWHTTDGDALSVCTLEDGELYLNPPDAGALYYPVGAMESAVGPWLTDEIDKAVIAIDAALAWPESYAQLVQHAPHELHLPSFQLGQDIDNPYLYRETERFVKRRILRSNEKPLTAPSDKFGNNFSKGQALVAWLKHVFPDAYRPLFDGWDLDCARAQTITVVEVYPEASLRCSDFDCLKLTCSPGSSYQCKGVDEITSVRDQLKVNKKPCDRLDALICALTSACYARTVGIINGDFPTVYTPPAADGYDQTAIRREGWIFAPKSAECTKLTDKTRQGI